jgi:hypothetical protein
MDFAAVKPPISIEVNNNRVKMTDFITGTLDIIRTYSYLLLPSEIGDITLKFTKMLSCEW